ncbi:hypothetical protein KFZ58_02860 [Virgibacillus sp. NKC19-16]|uniref:hypothetical protein n=1 Tax=Virgibacillus salidurans TaxID=2831673 RepID=UPI001F27FD2A|nr:hypothetical protein [Virgibacillus sp. NKC19-16]UJL46904.1 hypothetical protein KFZ58_02860 [Virgibacillus sp. NKC19-16]
MSRLIQEKINERENAAYVEFAKGDDEVLPDKSFDQLTEELKLVRKDYRKIDYLIAKANIDHIIKWEDGDLSIAEAIELAKQLRGEVNLLKRFGMNKPIDRLGNYHMQETIYRKALFDPSKLKERAMKLEKKANRLSMAIEKQNHQVEVEFAEAEQYL